MQWTTLGAVPLAILLCWLYTIMAQRSFPTLTNKRIVLLIAHPDDEAMFFAPTLLSLTERSKGNHVKILCLSSGNADGLGSIRKKELVKSGLHLGLRSEDDVLVLDDPNFPDSMTIKWSPPLISSILNAFFVPSSGSSKSKSASSFAQSSSPPTPSIDVIITFDAHGISSHPNHISLYHGARHFLSSLKSTHPGWADPIALYTLRTTFILRKYLSVLDTPLTVLLSLFSRKKAGSTPTPLMFVSGPLAYGRAQRAMTHAHKSQMVWFRWGWIGLSRYMVVNDLNKERVI
ncbi:LmbE-like protein [Xylona heveae TC161]|uniref:N-acetylglucosaminylphosphatidylinositol deacetylase n=1 Tax=Xylona heveae (strain CBS 132557 / TC161) TaxID=1328760 RepID=A0A165JVJ9_XYLHT|nr:LmbE-like protein [Xylona heveae TC161]KZF26685.1 LmbE-like protein [Xylona heveae TC161]